MKFQGYLGSAFRISVLRFVIHWHLKTIELFYPIFKEGEFIGGKIAA
jgi:hypothetical protein